MRLEDLDKIIPEFVSLAGGVRTDVDTVQLPQNVSPRSTNFIHRGGVLIQRPGTNEYNSFGSRVATKTNRFTGIKEVLFGRSSSRFLLFASSVKIYFDDGATVTDATGGLLGSGGDLNPWYFSSGIDSSAIGSEGLVFLTNGADRVLYWPMTASVPAIAVSRLDAAVGYTGPANLISKYVCVHNGRVVFGYTTEAGVVNPKRTRVSELNNFLGYDATKGASAVDHADSDGEITGLYSFDGKLIVGKSDSIIPGIETGNKLAPFAYSTPIPVGIFSGKSFNPINKKVAIFLGEDNFYAWTGGEPEPIGDGIKRDLFSRLNYNRRLQVVSHVDKAQSIYRCWIPIDNNDYATRAYCYNFLENLWWFEDWPGEVHEATNVTITTPITIGSLSGTIGSYTSPIGDWGGSGGEPQPVIGCSYDTTDKRIFKFTNTNNDSLSSVSTITPTHESKDFRLSPSRKSTLKGILLHYSSLEDTTITVEVSVDRGKTWFTNTLPAPKGDNKELLFNFLIVSRFHRFRISTNRQLESGGGSASLTNPIEIQTAEISFVSRGLVI